MKGDDISERLLGLGVMALRIGGRLRRDVVGKHIQGQLARSATSGGANYEEARAAESRADFVHKVGLAAKEVREAIYWLRLVHAMGHDVGSAGQTSLEAAIREAAELAAILMASGRTARANTA